MRSVKTDLRGLNATDVLNRARITLTAMSGNPHFPNPIPSMADLGSACDALEKSNLQTLMGGNKLQFAIKQQRLDTVKDMMKSLAGYVQAVAQGDTAIVLSGGFEERRVSHRITALEAPQWVRARTGRLQGSIVVRWAPVHGARMYQLFICKGNVLNEQEWTPLVPTSSSRIEVTGLDSLTYYSFRLYAMGTSAKSPMSQSATALSIGPMAA